MATGDREEQGYQGDNLRRGSDNRTSNDDNGDQHHAHTTEKNWARHREPAQARSALTCAERFANANEVPAA
ncbi:hypothetical protein D3C76_330820 [compost metagenome]